MKKFDSKLLNLGYLGYRFVSPILDPIKATKSLLKYPKYFKSILDYSLMKDSEKVEIENLFPVLTDGTSFTPFDSHYFYQDIWAAKKIFKSKTKNHYDIGSRLSFVGFLTTFTKVKFGDVRPVQTDLKNFESVKADILNLPFKSNSIKSLSCLHVAEHIGLGRYGDELNPNGTRDACRELSRVLLKGGNLYFSLPVGQPRICFNAHRVHSPKQILKYFDGLKLVELSGITDKGDFVENIDIKKLEKSNYACGIFHFKK